LIAVVPFLLTDQKEDERWKLYITHEQKLQSLGVESIERNKNLGKIEFLIEQREEIRENI